MRNYLNNYHMQITALSPIHVGDGKQMGKKEYIQLRPQGPVLVPDLQKMFQYLSMMHKDAAYSSFMLGNSKDGLGQWLIQQKIDKKKIESWTKYQMDAGDAFIKVNNGKNGTPKDIRCFVKDAYGNPYVPGSGMKGMIRTALLAKEIRDNPDSFDSLLDEVFLSARDGGRRNSFLQKETRNLETEAFHSLTRDEKKKSNAINSIMSGLIVSDSLPIGTNNLILTQKIDYSLDRKENPLPILREALAPGTKISFSITIDTDLCKYTIEDILEALDDFQMDCYRYFHVRFGRGTKNDGIVWLGGGTGFLSKTIIYSAFEERGVRVTDSIFKTTLGNNYYKHKHDRDLGVRLAPHVCKCTRYHGKLYDMGMGKIEVVS